MFTLVFMVENIGQFASENVDFLKCSVKAVFVSL